MGSQGTDIVLSEAARKLFSYAVECKSRESMAVYEMFRQACFNAGDTLIPLLVIKENHEQPLVVMSLDHFMELLK